MPMQLKDLVKLNHIIERIQRGRFDENDVDNLLMKLRPYAGSKTLFLEVAHFVAHSDARNRGLALQSITAFVDSIQYFQEFVSVNRPLDFRVPFPSYIYRLLLSQTLLADEKKLRAEYKMSHATLKKKIETNFLVDKKAGTYCLRDNKGGSEFLEALYFVISFIYSKPAFHIRDFHQELKDVMNAQKIIFDEVAWDAQTDSITLAILCLISNTDFALENGSIASCKLRTDNHFRLLSGHRLLPTGALSTEPTSFGRLMILGEATINSKYKDPVRMRFPLIATDLDPHEHCEPDLFVRIKPSEDFGNCIVETIAFAADMSLSDRFKLVPAELSAQ